MFRAVIASEGNTAGEAAMDHSAMVGFGLAGGAAGGAEGGAAGGMVDVDVAGDGEKKKKKKKTHDRDDGDRAPGPGRPKLTDDEKAQRKAQRNAKKKAKKDAEKDADEPAAEGAAASVIATRGGGERTPPAAKPTKSLVTEKATIEVRTVSFLCSCIERFVVSHTCILTSSMPSVSVAQKKRKNLMASLEAEIKDHERKEEKLKTKIDEYVNTYEQSQSGSQTKITVAVKNMIAFANKLNDTQREAVAALFHAAGDSIASTSQKMDDLRAELSKLKERFIQINEEQTKLFDA